MGNQKGQISTGDAGTAIAAGAVAAFACDLYQELGRTSSDNLFFSPYSLSTALTMAYAGARDETAAQMARVLHLPQEEGIHASFSALANHLEGIEQSGTMALHVANGLWPHQDYAFLDTYLDLMSRTYSAPITAVDYGQADAARRQINEWVAGKTRDTIPEIIPPGILNALTRLVLTNAIYFKAAWTNPFDAKNTQEAPFWLADGGSVSVPLMEQEAELGYAEADGLQILQMNYGFLSVPSFVILLPTTVDGLARIEQALSPAQLDGWLDQVRPEQVRIYLPRFRTRQAYSLARTLSALGMPAAFGDNSDFSGMDGSRMLYISHVLHQAFLDVNEKGTEASAATAVIMALRGLSLAQPYEFRADHPFLFLIYERGSGTILFVGRFVRPE